MHALRKRRLIHLHLNCITYPHTELGYSEAAHYGMNIHTYVDTEVSLRFLLSWLLTATEMTNPNLMQALRIYLLCAGSQRHKSRSARAEVLL